VEVDPGLSEELLAALLVEDDAASVSGWLVPDVKPATDMSDHPPLPVFDFAGRVMRDMDEFADQHAPNASIPVATTLDAAQLRIEVLDTPDLDVLAIALRDGPDVGSLWLMDADATVVSLGKQGGTWDARFRRIEDDGTVVSGFLFSDDTATATTTASTSTPAPSVVQRAATAYPDDGDVGWYCGPLNGRPRGLELLGSALSGFERSMDELITGTKGFLDDLSFAVEAVDRLISAVDGAQDVVEGLGKAALEESLGLVALGMESVIDAQGIAGVTGPLGKLGWLSIDTGIKASLVGTTAALEGWLLEAQVALIGATVPLGIARTGVEQAQEVVARVPGVRSALATLVDGPHGFSDARRVLATLNWDAVVALNLSLSPIPLFPWMFRDDYEADFTNCPSNTPPALDAVVEVTVESTNPPARPLPNALAVEVVSGCPDLPCEVVVAGPEGEEVSMVPGETAFVGIDPAEVDCGGAEEAWTLRAEIGGDPLRRYGRISLPAVRQLTLEVESPQCGCPWIEVPADYEQRGCSVFHRLFDEGGQARPGLVMSLVQQADNELVTRQQEYQEAASVLDQEARERNRRTRAAERRNAEDCASGKACLVDPRWCYVTVVDASTTTAADAATVHVFGFYETYDGPNCDQEPSNMSAAALVTLNGSVWDSSVGYAPGTPPQGILSMAGTDTAALVIGLLGG
jgi:hypothetical protein